jgi:hypothetical protein
MPQASNKVNFMNMLYRLNQAKGGSFAIVDRKQIPCYYSLFTDDEIDQAKDDGWLTLAELIKVHENPNREKEIMSEVLKEIEAESESDTAQAEAVEPAPKRRGRPRKQG